MINSKFNFYGYSVKYCIPNIIIGKIVRKAKIYYKENYVCDFTYNSSKKEVSLNYLSPKVEETMALNIEYLNKKYNTPDTVIQFIMRLFDYLEIFNHQQMAIKNKNDGIIAVMDNNLSFEFIVPIVSFSKELKTTIFNKFSCQKCFYISSSEKKFIAENIFK